MPESLSDPAQAMGLVEFTEFMVAISLARVQEVGEGGGVGGGGRGRGGGGGGGG